ncbi:MAG TPA: globin domain-containing protein [Flavisolibacter sp.]|nr:globin domain-containing protein [Flavisolibacter sp.]
MTAHQIALVRKTWKVYRTIDPVLVGDVFYSKLFTTTPQLKNLFYTSKEEQSKKLVDMLSMIVGRLDRMNELTEDIRQLAIRHKGYGVQFRHYDLVEDALMWTLAQGLGSDWNEEVKEAWQQCYQILSRSMQEAVS